MSMANSGNRRGPVSSLLQNNNVLGFLFMLPAAVFLVCFLTCLLYTSDAADE